MNAIPQIIKVNHWGKPRRGQFPDPCNGCPFCKGINCDWKGEHCPYDKEHMSIQKEGK